MSSSCCHETEGCVGQGEKHMCPVLRTSSPIDPNMFMPASVEAAPDSLIKAVRDHVRTTTHGTFSAIIVMRLLKRIDETESRYRDAQEITDKALDVAERALQCPVVKIPSLALFEAMRAVVEQARNVSPKFSGSTEVLRQKVEDFDRILLLEPGPGT